MDTKLAVISMFQAHIPSRVVSGDEDLFTLGVDSLTVVTLALEIEQAFGVPVAPEVFVTCTSPAALAQWIDDQRATYGLT